MSNLPSKNKQVTQNKVKMMLTTQVLSINTNQYRLKVNKPDISTKMGRLFISAVFHMEFAWYTAEVDVLSHLSPDIFPAIAVLFLMGPCSPSGPLPASASCLLLDRRTLSALGSLISVSAAVDSCWPDCWLSHKGKRFRGIGLVPL